MTGHTDRRVLAAALALIASLALAAGLIAEARQDDSSRPPAPASGFFAVTLA